TSQRAQSGQFAAFREQAEEVAKLRIGSNIVLSGPDGRQLLNTLRRPEDALPMHGNPEQLREVFATGRPVISDLYTGGVLRRPVMSVDVPVFRAGKVVFDLSIGETPERFRAILSEQDLPAGWIGVVLDRRGTIVARTQQHERFVGQRAAEALVKGMARSPEGSVETDTLEGIPVISAYSRSPATGWGVALGIPRDSVMNPLWNRSIIVGDAVVVILALGLALAWGIGGSIAASIRALEKPAAEIGRREEIQVPPLGLREADEVGQALVRAAHMIAVAQHRAQHDPLTGLANRALFLEMAAHNVETAKRTGVPLSLLFIDLDGFKQVNDTLGHDAGDRLLCGVADRLKAAGRGSDVPARMGGDEFAMLLPGVDADGSATFAAKLAASLAEPYAVGAHPIVVTASIGTSTYPHSGMNAHDLVKRADEAMYRVKTAKLPATANR
ncbi:MAG TPA: GGDEF domain-containing protein, partial [Usitatibacter sp.]|nr:GGDEF domain-containing protein [Usitatibacter sp.]